MEFGDETGTHIAQGRSDATLQGGDSEGGALPTVKVRGLPCVAYNAKGPLTPYVPSSYLPRNLLAFSLEKQFGNATDCA